MALVDSDANLDSVAASLHDYGGVCDYCGKQCDPELQDLNLVCCSFAKCPTPMVFHQCCVDEYLKKRKLGKDAKIGFPCLRGYSNKSADYEKPCKGRVFRLHHVHARMENSKKRQKAKMPENFVPGKREKKEKADEGQPDKAPAKPAKAVAPAAKPLQPLVNIFAPANKQPAKKPVPPAVPKPPADMDQSKMDAIRKQVEAMRQKKGNPSAKPAADSFAKAKKPPSRQDQLMVQHALESAQAGHVAGIPSGWANGAPSEAPPAEDAEDSDEEGEWMTVMGRKKGKAAAKPPAGVSRKQAKKQAWHDKQAALKAAQAPDPTPAESAVKAVRKPPVQAPPASPAPLFNAWGKPSEEQPQAPPPPRSPSPPMARPASPPVWRPSPSPPPAVQGLRSWSEKLLTVLKEHKIRVATKQLLELGFPDWLSVTAVRACGTDVDRCCEWLNSGQSPADPIIDLTAELARISKWVSVGCLSQDVVEISLVSCSGDIDAAETVLRANFDHFAEHSSAAFAPDPTPAPAPTGPVQNSWSDDLFPLNWGAAGRDSVAPRPAPPPRKKEQPAPPLKDPPRPHSASKPQTPADPPRPESPPKPQTPAFEIPKTMLAGNGSYITDLSRYNELLGISDDDSDEDVESEEGEAGADSEVRDPASLLKEYLGGSDSVSNKAEVPAPATPPASEARSAQNGMSNGLDTDDLLAAYGIFPKAAVSTPRPYLPGLKYEREGPEEDQDTLVSQLMTQLLV